MSALSIFRIGIGILGLVPWAVQDVWVDVQLFGGIMIVMNAAVFGWLYIYKRFVLPLQERRRLQRAEMLATQAFWSDLVPETGYEVYR